MMDKINVPFDEQAWQAEITGVSEIGQYHLLWSSGGFLAFLNQGNNEILKLLDRLWSLNGGLPLMAMWLGLNTVNS